MGGGAAPASSSGAAKRHRSAGLRVAVLFYGRLNDAVKHFENVKDIRLTCFIELPRVSVRSEYNELS